MLAEAIKNARDTTAQFAKESGSKLGSVSRGNQGVFDISDKDPGSPQCWILLINYLILPVGKVK